MQRGRASISSLVSALVLAVLTGGVFWILQDYGPESALRKFHRAAVNRDLRELSQVVTQDSFRQNVELLAAMVEGYARNGARYQLREVNRQNRRVIAEVEYVFPNRGLSVPMFWVVVKDREGWKVSANDTEAVRRRMYGM
jgi:hypothetical protein